MADLIDRQAAIDAVCTEGCGQCRNALATIPDADPEDAGKVYWDSGITENGNARCSKCGFLQIGVYDREGFQAFCGHCGEKMTGVRRSALWRSRT